MNKIMFSSEKQDHETPHELFNMLNEIFSFKLDLAANNYNTKCDIYFDEDKNSLNQDWAKYSDWSWLNPPYGQNISIWIEKAYIEYKNGANICMLLPSRTDTRWQHDYVFKAPFVVFIKGRLKFGNEKNGAPFPSQLVFFGDISKEMLVKIRDLKLGFVVKAGE